MKATINITTPAGKSLEGFPLDFDKERREYFWLSEDNRLNLSNFHSDFVVQLHKGDTITIKIEE